MNKIYFALRVMPSILSQALPLANNPVFSSMLRVTWHSDGAMEPSAPTNRNPRSDQILCTMAAPCKNACSL